MRQAGIEPATLGLKVRAEPLRHRAAGGYLLQLAQSAAAATCNGMPVAEASPYSNPYSLMLPYLKTTAGQLRSASRQT
jgi:hypothetical protein